MTQWEIVAWVTFAAWAVSLVVSIAILVRTNRNANKIDKIHVATDVLVEKIEVAAHKAGEVVGEAKGRKDEQSDERERVRDRGRLK